MNAKNKVKFAKDLAVSYIASGNLSAKVVGNFILDVLNSKTYSDKDADVYLKAVYEITKLKENAEAFYTRLYDNTYFVDKERNKVSSRMKRRTGK